MVKYKLLRDPKEKSFDFFKINFFIAIISKVFFFIKYVFDKRNKIFSPSLVIISLFFALPSIAKPNQANDNEWTLSKDIVGVKAYYRENIFCVLPAVLLKSQNLNSYAVKIIWSDQVNIATNGNPVKGNIEAAINTPPSGNLLAETCSSATYIQLVSKPILKSEDVITPFEYFIIQILK